MAEDKDIIELRDKLDKHKASNQLASIVTMFMLHIIGCILLLILVELRRRRKK